MNGLRCAVSVGGLMLVTGNVAAASSGHYDSGHLAVMAVIGGAVALGSSALGGYLGGSASAKRGEHGYGAAREPNGPGEDADAATVSAKASGLDVKKVATTASDYAVKLVKEASPRGEAIDTAYKVVKGAVTDPNAATGVADSLADLATAELKKAVNSGAAEGIASPDAIASPGPVTQPAGSGALGATTRFCRECGTPAREGGRFCASCGRKLA